MSYRPQFVLEFIKCGKTSHRILCPTKIVSPLSASQEVSTHWQRNGGGTLQQALTLYLWENNNTLPVILAPVRRPIAPKTQSEPSQTGVSRGHLRPLRCDCWLSAAARAEEAALTSGTSLLSLSATKYLLLIYPSSLLQQTVIMFLQHKL